MSIERNAAAITIEEDLSMLESFSPEQVEDFLEGLGHEALSEVFGSRVAHALRANERQNPYSVSAVRGFLQAVLNGVTAKDDDEPVMPEEFSKAIDELRSVSYTPRDEMQLLWKTRIYDRFVVSDDWIQWPPGELKSSIRCIEDDKHVPTVEASGSYYFLHKDHSKLIWLYVNPYGNVSPEVYGLYEKDIDEIIADFENYVESPDPYEGKILRLEKQGIKIIPPTTENLSPYNDEIEDAVSWMTSIADENIRKMLREASLPSRAGLLLEGPPGSGKTTLSRRIANDLAGDVTVIYATPAVPIQDIFTFSNRYDPALIILEDVESFFGERGESSFSDFLNELDGVDQRGGKMILATSNDSSEFDEAVRRPGRLERRAIIADVQEGAHASMISSRLVNEPESIVEKLVEAVELKAGDKTITPAVIDSLVRHGIMLRLQGEALVDYAMNQWVPHYEGISYLSEDAPSASSSGRNPNSRKRSRRRS